MTRVLVIDTAGDSREALEKALDAAGYEVVLSAESSAASTTEADAIVLATDVTGLAQGLRDVQAARAKTGVPVVLVTSLDRSGWDRTFGAEEGLDVDALFNKPVDTRGLVARLEGILKARRSAERMAASPEMADILERAIADEEASEEFYRRAAAAVTRADSREVLESLMRDEAAHRKLLEEFRSGSRALPEAPPPAGSVVEAFGAPDFSPDMSPADAFLLAANKERLAVDMYENWAKLYPPGGERELLERLAEMERGHKAKVEEMFANAAFPEVW